MNPFKLHKLDYLKSINYDDIMEDNKCSATNDISVTLNKCVLARNAYFGAKLALLNFISDCEKLEEKLQTDLSGADLENIKEEYTTYANTLSTSLISSLRQVYIDKYIMNVDFPRYNPNVPLICDLKSAKSNILEYTSVNQGALKNINFLCYLPGIVMYSGKDYHLQIKFSEPESVASDMLLQQNLGNLLKSRIKINPDVDKCFTIVGPINNYLEILDYNGPYAFQSVDTARFFLTDIINYHNGISINSDIIRVLGYFNKLIVNVENAHRTVINAYKIYDVTLENLQPVTTKVNGCKCISNHTNCESASVIKDENIKTVKKCVCVNNAHG
jgi:hypothetical protein